MGWRGLAITAAVSGLAAVVLAALGAHLLAETNPDGQHLWATALQMHFFHTAALLGIAAIAQRMPSSTMLTWSGVLLALGTLLFSGSLYLKAAGISLLPGQLTPLGGWLLMAGWVLLALTLVRKTAI